MASRAAGGARGELVQLQGGVVSDGTGGAVVVLAGARPSGPPGGGAGVRRGCRQGAGELEVGGEVRGISVNRQSSRGSTIK